MDNQQNKLFVASETEFLSVDSLRQMGISWDEIYTARSVVGCWYQEFVEAIDMEVKARLKRC